MLENWTSRYAQASQKMGTAIYAQTQPSAEPGTAEGESAGQAQDDEVVDAEIVDEDKPREGGAA